MTVCKIRHVYFPNQDHDTVTRTNTLFGGFTLIELLVVILIVGILASLLLPVFVQARRTSRKVRCIGNMSQIGKAFWMYAADWDDRLPKEWNPPMGDKGGFDEVLDPYIKSRKIWICPDNPTKGVDAFTPPDQSQPRHYAMVSEEIRTVYPFSKYKAPSETTLMAEEYCKDSSGNNRSAHIIEPLPAQMGQLTAPPNHWPKVPYQTNLFWDAHSGGANYLMFDTHVRWMKWEQTVRPRNMWTMNPND